MANSELINKVIVPNRHLKAVLNKKGVKPNKIAIVPSTIETKEDHPFVETIPNGTRDKLGLKKR